MFGVLFLIILFYVLNQAIFGVYQKKHSFFNKKKMNLLYLYHLLFYGVYLWYANNNPSDSAGYFRHVNEHPGTWLELFGTDTNFIEFLAYPFAFVGFNYNMLMLVFAWFGFLGFMYAYLFFREKIPIKVKVFRSVDLLTLILFLPNMHFWTASLGKGSAIFLGLMMFTYAIARPGSRLLLLVLGAIIIYYIRPHVFLFVAVGAVVGYMSGKQSIPLWQKLAVFIGLIGGLVIAQDQILAVVGLQSSENLIEDFGSFSEDRAEDLQKAGSGVDLSSYPLPVKLFTFWFRPLFIDAPNILGLIVSFENLVYLLLFLKIIKKDFVKFIRKSPALVKMSFVIFFTTSFAMTFIMSNLGIIMRQKSMVMYFLFFVIYYYLAEKKYLKVMKIRKLRALNEKRRIQNLVGN
ncbi:hypothetical protein [Salinimicrobium sp. TH3]|uniref:hypothetical protein n=1 Tax=Salinimicrobium sp. TH3 TaxID=2997342 RepID=UPI00227253D4|nr:hypothetical protein [Salinimicrobium sp. TH3]MCY2686968.1 hypothetical protein [Salinimicrobium sp. TH3]